MEQQKENQHLLLLVEVSGIMMSGIESVNVERGLMKGQENV